MARKLDDEVDWENDLLDLTKETTHDEKVELLGKLLDSESTLFSKKMRDWLIKDDALKVLIHYVTRPVKKEGEQPQDLSFSILNSEEYIISSNRRRDALLASEEEKKALREQQKQNGEEESLDEEEEDDFAFSKEAKRADKAAEVFVYQAASLPQDFVDKNLEEIVKEIFAIFDINAEGDFDNFDKMFASLLGPYGSKVFNVFSKNRKLILHLLNYLHDPAISETLMGVIKATLPDQVLINFYTTLNEDGFWESLGQKIYGPASDSSYEDAAAFFNRLVDLGATQSNADVLFSHLSQNMSFVDGLIDCISDNSRNLPAEQQIAAINAVRAILLKSGEQLYDTSLEAYTPTPVPNMLSCIHDDLHSHLKTRAGALSQKLVDDAKQPKKKADEAVFSTFRVPSRFSVHRVHLLEVIAELTQQSPQEVLNSFGVPLWKVLSDWLFEHRFNNIYHDLFYRLFRTVIKINHVDSMKALLSKHKFVTRMIEHYKTTNSKDSGLRSYIIMMANYMRLTADSQPPTEYLRSFLTSHVQWKEFVPLLKEDTIKQFVTDFPAPSGGHPLSPFGGAETFGLYSTMVTTPKPIAPEDVDVDLGSEYANMLGLEDASVYVETKKKRKRKRKGKNKKANGEEEKSENAEADEGEGDGDDSDGSGEEGEEEEGDEGAVEEEETPALEEVSALEEEAPTLEEETPVAGGTATPSSDDAAPTPVEGDVSA